MKLCKIEFGVACSLCILLGIWHIRFFFFTFCSAIIWIWETSLDDWKMLIRWCRTDICSYKLSAKISFMLGNPVLVPSFCKLNHISVWFIQISTKSPASSNGFFWSHPRCFGPLGKFQHNIKPSRRSVFPDYLSVYFDCGLKQGTFYHNIFYPERVYKGSLKSVLHMYV